MADGSFKYGIDLYDGDLIMGLDSKPFKVWGIKRGRKTLINIKQKNGNVLRLTADHILDEKPLYELKTCNLTRTTIEFDEIPVSTYSIGFRLIDMIPKECKFNSIQKRREFIAAIIDRFGYVRSNSLVLYLSSKWLDDILYICLSIGLDACKTNDNITIYGDELNNIPCKLLQNRYKTIINNQECDLEISEMDYYCEVPNKVITDDFILI